MIRRDFIKISSIAGAGILAGNTLSSCMGTYNPKIINAIWNEKFIFDSNDKALKVKQLIRCAVMAPSGHNTQPWLFHIDEDKIEIAPDFKRSLPIADKSNRELFISLGAALENLLIAAPLFGFNAEVEIDEENPKIIIHLNAGKKIKNVNLFSPMIERQTTRNEYVKTELAENFIEQLSPNKEKDISLFFTKKKSDIDVFVDFIKEGNRLQFGNEKFLDELKNWIRFSDSEAEEKLDGLYVRALGNPSTAGWFGRFAFNMSVTPETQNQEDVKFINSASGLLFVFALDGIKSWIETGRLLESVLIRITGMGLKYAFHNQPCQAIALRKDFAKSFEHKGLMPQAAIRIGKGEYLPRSPRRKIKDVII